MTNGVIVDADSHVMEPANLWLDYLEPEFKSRAMRIELDDAGLEYLSIDGNMSIQYCNGALGRIAAIEQDRAWMQEHRTLPYSEVAVLAPGSVDPHERVNHLDREGIDKTFVFPTLSLGSESECRDPALSAAYARAYNRWASEFCSPYPDRLFAAAHINLRSIDEAVKEISRAAEDGMKGAFICPATVNGIRYGHEYYDPFWAAAQDLDMPVTMHVATHADYPGRSLYPGHEAGLGNAPVAFMNMMSIPDPIIMFTSMMADGLFEKFPRLRFAMVEIGCTWVAHWLDIMDDKIGRFGFDTPLTMSPSDYFKRQCWISAEPNEKGLGFIAELVGPDRFMWGSDWPHPEGHTDPLGKVKQNIVGLPEEDRRKILGENALSMYGLPVPVAV